MNLYNLKYSDKKAVIRFNEVVTIFEIDRIGEKIMESLKTNIDNYDETIVNLKYVDYVDSAFLSFIIQISIFMKEQQKKFVVTNIKDKVMKIFKISHLNKILNLEGENE